MSKLIVENINHSYESGSVLKNISFMAAPSSITCVLGASGSGKTTLLRLLGGFERLQKGRISLNDTSIVCTEKSIDLAPEKRCIGMMFQDYALFPHLSLRQNLLFGLKKNNHRRKAWVLEAAERLGIGKLLHKYPYELSGGEQQRAALLRAIAPEPQLLLLDEPFSGLDPHLRRQTRDEVISFIRSVGITTMVVTHDPEEAHYMADQLLVLDKGSIIQMGSPKAVRKMPASSMVASFFGATNRFEVELKDGAAHLPILTEALALNKNQKRVILQCYPEKIKMKKGNDFTLIQRFMVDYGGERLVYEHNETKEKYVVYNHLICSHVLGDQSNLEIDPQDILVFDGE